MKKISLRALSIKSGAVVAGLLLALMLAAAPAWSQTPVSGWAWSEIGWLSLTSDNDDGATYGLTRNADGTVTGYAWSENIGWVKFGGLSGFPTGSGTTATNAAMNGSETGLVGWARACGGTVSGNCSSMVADSGGWDGWIALSGTATDGSSYSVTSSSGDLAGYGWGSDVVGAVGFDGSMTCTVTTPICSDSTHVSYIDSQCATHVTDCAPYTCAVGAGGAACTTPSGCLSTNATSCVPQDTIRSGTTVTLYWTIVNASTCTLTGTNGESYSGLSSAGSRTTLALTERTTFTLSCNSLTGPPLSATAVINMLPVYQEI